MILLLADLYVYFLGEPAAAAPLCNIAATGALQLLIEAIHISQCDCNDQDKLMEAREIPISTVIAVVTATGGVEG